MNSCARMKFSSFFSYLCGWDTNSRSQFVTVWKRIQFCMCSFSSSTLSTNSSLEKFSFSERWIRVHEWNFPYFSVSSAGESQILDLNLWYFQREFNSAVPPFLLLLSARIFHKKNFNFLKDEFVCTNEIFLIFQLLVQLRPKFWISISDSLKENSILHLLLSLFYFHDEFFWREIFIFSKLNSSARMKFLLIFQFLLQVRPKFSISICESMKENSILHLLIFFFYTARIFHKKSFHFLKAEFVCTNEIFLIFHFLVRFRHKFSIWIYDSLKENSILHLLIFFFYSQHEFLKRKILILR